MELYIIYTQIFEVCNFRGWTNFRIFAVLFLRITHFILLQSIELILIIVIFQGSKFHGKPSNSRIRKNYVPQKFVCIPGAYLGGFLEVPETPFKNLNLQACSRSTKPS